MKLQVMEYPRSKKRHLVDSLGYGYCGRNIEVRMTLDAGFKIVIWKGDYLEVPNLCQGCKEGFEMHLYGLGIRPHD